MRSYLSKNNSPYVCVPCRVVLKESKYGNAPRCPKCGEKTVGQSYRWRAPKKSNDAAWKLIESGDWLWDKRVRRGFRPTWRDRDAFRNPKHGQSLIGKELDEAAKVQRERRRRFL